MANHPNVYENLKEAQFRLNGTIVMYDGIPYYVIAITSHKSDGIFRVYLDPINWDGTSLRSLPNYSDYSPEDSRLGTYIDKWMDDNPKSLLIRKQMNSPKFNKFKPFQLGMCNYGTRTYYLERQPVRRHEQGLTRSSVSETRVTLDEGRKESGGMSVEFYSNAFHACVLGQHPSAEDCMKNLLDSEVENEAGAFHRQFALVRGPIGMIFLAYKTHIIGVVPYGDFSKIKLGKNFPHTKEVVEGLGLFDNIVVTA